MALTLAVACAAGGAGAQGVTPIPPRTGGVGEFAGLGDLAGGTFESFAIGVSGDGSVVVGRGTSASGIEAFRWTSAGGMVGLGDLAGGDFHSVANGVSGDGSVVVGHGMSASGIEAFRWTPTAGMVGLGDLAGGSFGSLAYGVSGDGSVVVGQGRSASGNEAFRWTKDGGMVGLGDLAGGDFSSVAYGVSSDGSVVVGQGRSASGNEAFRWTPAGGMVGLGDLAGGIFLSYANGVSGDGSVVVGRGTSASGIEAFRWTSAGGMVGLGDLPGGVFFSEAFAASGDGSVVVGMGYSARGFEAFRWTQAGGMQRVVDWLSAAGVTVAAGYAMNMARGVSADGSVVVGLSSGPSGLEAFIARVSPIGSGAVTVSDLQYSLLGVAQAGAISLRAANTVINGAHSRPLAWRVAAGQSTAWTAGDWGADHHGSRDGDLGLAEVGVGRNFGAWQGNLSLGRTWANQTLLLNGSAKTDGQYLLAEALFPLRSDLWVTLSGYGHWGVADLKRGYFNAGTAARSTGTPGVDGWGVRARLDWENAYNLASTELSPYVDLIYGEARLDGYTETGGGFPATFDARTAKATELRLGVNGAMPLDSGLTLTNLLEFAHRFEDRGARTTGQVLGLFNFDLDARKNNKDWLRAGIGIEGRLAGGRASVSLNATSQGEVPSYWLSASWQTAF